MKLNSTFVLSSILAFSAFGISAQEAKVSISPAPGEYDVLPTEFVLTIDGPTSIAKNITGGNPLLITSPSGISQQLTGTFSGNQVTCKMPATPVISLDESGNYTVTVRAGSITYKWDDVPSTKSEKTDFIYVIKGNGQGGGDEDDTVKYDIEMIKTTPSLNPLDLEMKTLETLQLYFDKGDLQIDPAVANEALVTITGPSYRQSAQLLFNMKSATSTVFKAYFNDPVYSGDYTLTIPEGILGDQAWIEDHSKGHANAAVTLEFKAEGGKDPSTLTKDLSFNPTVTPAIGSKLTELKEISLEFPSTPYYSEGLSFEVSYSGAGSHFSAVAAAPSSYKANIQKVDGNTVILELESAAVEAGQYSLIIPEGTFWNAAHENDSNAGSLNSKQTLNWNIVIPRPTAEVISHIPATDAKVAAFVKGEPGIVINTDNNDVVESLEVEVVGYQLENDYATPVNVVKATSTDKTDAGQICWKNTSNADILLLSDYYYEVNYKIYAADNVLLTDGSFEFYGASEAITSVTVTDHTPATDAKVAAFVNGEEGIIIDTDNNSLVETLEVKVVAIKVGDTETSEEILDAVSTEKTANGQICWKNDTGADIELNEDTVYEVSYKLLNVDGDVLAEGSFEFAGATASGVALIEAEQTNVIYNTLGVKIQGDVNSLPAGLYIINGKKTAIR